MIEAFGAWSGPRDAKLVVLGEAWGQTEEQVKRPFAGSSGIELWRMLGEANPDVAPELHARIARSTRFGPGWVREREEWLSAAGIAFTNVFALRPRDNKIENISTTKDELPSGYSLPPIQLRPNLFVCPEYESELDRLHAELRECRPNLVVLAGNTACWAMLGEMNIGTIRGNAAMGRVLGRGDHIKVLPTYHPAGVLRQWSWRPIVVADLMKASREARSPELRRPSRKIVINPMLGEIVEWVDATLRTPPALIACDTETTGGQISMFGFARARDEALLVPFIDKSRPGNNYWPEAWQEVEARKQCNRLLASSIPKVFQNGMYDYQYALREGFRMANLAHDSMLLHHSILPEMQKGLGFLGSVYSSEPTWKTMRVEKMDTEKRDE